MTERRFLTIKEVASRYGVSRVTIWKWLKERRTGFPRPVQIGERTPRFRLSDLETYEQRLAAEAQAQVEEAAG